MPEPVLSGPGCLIWLKGWTSRTHCAPCSACAHARGCAISRFVARITAPRGLQTPRGGSGGLSERKRAAFFCPDQDARAWASAEYRHFAFALYKSLAPFFHSVARPTAPLMRATPTKSGPLEQLGRRRFSSLRRPTLQVDAISQITPDRKNLRRPSCSGGRTRVHKRARRSGISVTE